MNSMADGRAYKIDIRAYVNNMYDDKLVEAE